MAVVQNGTGSQLPHACALADEDVVVKWKNRVYFTYLLLLASVCTIGLYLLQIQVLKKISAFTVNLSYNLEPIYSIILAMLLFSEAKELNAAFYIGLGVIILSVILQTLSVIRSNKKI